MPLLTLGFFCLQLDRGDIANALTDTLLHDLRSSRDQFNVGQQMLSLGIVLFEIPSNMILYRVGSGKWLTLQRFLFGTVSTFQAWVTNYGSSSPLVCSLVSQTLVPSLVDCGYCRHGNS